MTKLAHQVLGWAGTREGWGRVYSTPSEDAEWPGHGNAFRALQRRLVRGGLIDWCEIGQCYRLTAAGRVELAKLTGIWSMNGGLGPVGAELERLFGDQRPPSAKRLAKAA